MTTLENNEILKIREKLSNFEKRIAIIEYEVAEMKIRREKELVRNKIILSVVNVLNKIKLHFFMNGTKDMEQMLQISFII
jgi:hypothetical protein